MSSEQWVEFGDEKAFRVSNLGRVQCRYTYRGHMSAIVGDKWRDKTFTVNIGTNGGQSYLRVSVKINGKQKLLYVHRLVAIHFIPNHGQKPQVNHIDGNAKNNHATNLEWCTPKENMRNCIERGAFKYLPPRRCLTDDQVNEIRRLARQGITNKQISKMLPVHETVVSRIKNNHYYRDVAEKVCVPV